MKTPLLHDETLVRKGFANLQRGIETVGGHINLTSQRVIFESHVFNVQRGSTIVPLDQITGVTKCWTLFLNKIPLLPNSIAIATTDGTEQRLVLYSRQAWIDATDGQRRGHGV